ncbi:hypothetical protein JYU14_00845, partial [Simkania negevensis]|nr:hypothetical protein [Simkania negevensis]
MLLNPWRLSVSLLINHKNPIKKETISHGQNRKNGHRGGFVAQFTEGCKIGTTGTGGTTKIAIFFY